MTHAPEMLSVSQISQKGNKASKESNLNRSVNSPWICNYKWREPMIILNRFLLREVCPAPHLYPHLCLTRCTRGEGENASYMSKSCNAAGHQSEIQYEITADSAMRLWQQGQHGQQLRGDYRGGVQKGALSVALSLWFWLNAHNREFSSK